MAAEQPISTHKKSNNEPELHKYFRVAIKTQANDLHLKVGQPPKLRLYGRLKDTTGGPLTETKMEKLVFEILSPAQKEIFLQNGTLDFAHEIGEEDRFRINIFRQRGFISLAAKTRQRKRSSLSRAASAKNTGNDM
ncbi:MAG: hypothetical protein ACYS91_20160 [Planctomycetota bacterium]|jgi:twitching motility protein PilT